MSVTPNRQRADGRRLAPRARDGSGLAHRARDLCACNRKALRGNIKVMRLTRALPPFLLE
jgi:hypothetical protein